MLEDGALGDAGPLGDPLRGGSQLAVLEQGEQSVDESLSRALRTDGAAVPWASRTGFHGPSIVLAPGVQEPAYTPRP